MNAEPTHAHALPLSRQDGAGLLLSGTRELTRVRAAIDEVDGALETIAAAGDRGAERAARKLQRQLRRIEPSATLIGQVKAGKTSLVNALVGWPDLLPSDVNPWTSVVTSLHLSPRPHLGGDHASFRFFEEDEWTRLLDRGGRIGELAGRAGAEDEVAKVTQQLAAMREKSRRRLGNKFEMLMGQEHDYGYLDSELVERYVCLGDDFEDDTETGATQGRFADITKSADLYIQRDAWPIDFCLRDTPGVNDTFMMREQITIRAIRESRMCVVVLSAHQALSTVDLALIRLISNLDSREVILFVNRIDELSDPARQVPEIRDSIRRTLTDHRGPADAEIVFGSAYWANHALAGESRKSEPRILHRDAQLGGGRPARSGRRSRPRRDALAAVGRARTPGRDLAPDGKRRRPRGAVARRARGDEHPGRPRGGGPDGDRPDPAGPAA